jgi:heme exporter protein D
MGGYAAYVWPAYAVAAIILAVLLAVSLRGLRRREATLKLLEESRPRRRRAARHGDGPAADRAPAPAAEGGEG